MQDLITSTINTFDVRAQYPDSEAMNRLENYFKSGDLRARASLAISANAKSIITKAIAKSLIKSHIMSSVVVYSHF